MYRVFFSGERSRKYSSKVQTWKIYLSKVFVLRYFLPLTYIDTQQQHRWKVAKLCEWQCLQDIHWHFTFNFWPCKEFQMQLAEMLLLKKRRWRHMNKKSELLDETGTSWHLWWCIARLGQDWQFQRQLVKQWALQWRSQAHVAADQRRQSEVLGRTARSWCSDTSTVYSDYFLQVRSRRSSSQHSGHRARPPLGGSSGGRGSSPLRNSPRRAPAPQQWTPESGRILPQRGGTQSGSTLVPALSLRGHPRSVKNKQTKK